MNNILLYIYIYTTEYYSSLNKKKIFSCTKTLMKFENMKKK